jgi:glycosyltransferase involved in cell wall biosynthesis
VLVPLRDADALAQALAALLTDSARRDRLAAQARATAAHRHAADRIADEWVAWIDELRRTPVYASPPYGSQPYGS